MRVRNGLGEKKRMPQILPGHQKPTTQHNSHPGHIEENLSFKASSKSAKNEDRTFSLPKKGTCARPACVQQTCLSPRKQHISSFSLRHCLWTTDNDLLVRFLSLGNFQPRSLIVQILLPLACNQDHLHLAQPPPPCSPLLCKSDAPSSGFSAIQLFFQAEQLLPAPFLLTAWSAVPQDDPSFLFRALMLLHPSPKRCFCSLSFSLLHV